MKTITVYELNEETPSNVDYSIDFDIDEEATSQNDFNYVYMHEVDVYNNNPRVHKEDIEHAIKQAEQIGDNEKCTFNYIN